MVEKYFQQFFDPTKWGILPFYWRLVVRPYLRQCLTIIALMLGTSMLDVLTIAMTVPLLDCLSNSQKIFENRILNHLRAIFESWGMPLSSGVLTMGLLVTVVGLFIFRSAVMFWQQCTIAMMAHRLGNGTKALMLERHMGASWEYLLQRGRGAIINDIAMPAEAIYSSLFSISTLLTNGANSLFLVALMLYLSWPVTAVIGVVALGSLYFWRRYAERRALDVGRQLYGINANQTQMEVESTDGFKVIRLHVLESVVSERYRSLIVRKLQQLRRLEILSNGPSFVNEAIGGIIVLAIGIMALAFPALGVRISIFGAFLLAIRRINPAIAGMNGAVVTLGRSRRGLEVMDDLLYRLPGETKGQALVERVKEIRFNNVAFYYPSKPQQWVLKDFDLTLKCGGVTAIVGSTGAGKSTIANLLAGLYQPAAGTIMVNGAVLQDMDLSRWRKRLGFVSQDIFLFNTSVRENIALWQDAFSPHDIEWAAKIAQIHNFIMTLPDGYDTLVGDRGLRLSGGQAQRIAIARAIIRRPQVIIFDEATSALDNLTEKAVYEAIGLFRQEAVVVVVTHRLSTIKEASQIIVLKNGRVVEQGVHRNLMALNGIYAELSRTVILEDVKEPQSISAGP